MKSPVPPPPVPAATSAAYAELLEELLVALLRAGKLQPEAVRDFIASELWRRSDEPPGLRHRLEALRARLGSVPR